MGAPALDILNSPSRDAYYNDHGLPGSRPTARAAAEESGEGVAPLQYRSEHFVGIRGTGISAIAQVLLTAASTCPASDTAASPRTAMIEGLGGQVYIGHKAEHMGRCGRRRRLLRGAAGQSRSDGGPPPGHPPLAPGPHAGPAHGRPARRGHRGHPRQDDDDVHGGLHFRSGGSGPDGAHRRGAAGFPSNARIGRGEHTVVEADKSDRSLLLLSPRTALVTNIEADHLERHAGIEDIQETFRTFLRRLPADGLAVLCGDDERARSWRPALRVPSFCTRRKTT